MLPPIYIYEILKINSSYNNGKNTKQKLATNRTKNISLSLFNTLSEQIIPEITTFLYTYRCFNI